MTSKNYGALHHVIISCHSFPPSTKYFPQRLLLKTPPDPQDLSFTESRGPHAVSSRSDRLT